MSKKICFCLTLAGTYRAFLLGLSHYLIDEHNYDVTVVCSPDESMEALTSEHLHYVPVKMKRGLTLSGLSAICKMYRIFKNGKFDIVQYSTYNAGTYAAIASRLAGVKCRLYCQWGMMYYALKGWKRLLMWMDEKLICNLSSVIESESFSMYETSVSNNIYKKEKASVIWNGSACGVDLGKYELNEKIEWRKEIRGKYNIDEDAFVFGYCGRITRDKGINELLTAFREVLKQRNAYLMIIGGYDNALSIDQSLLAWAQSCPNVIFTGRTNTVPKYYSALDVFASLSYREGFGLVVIEAAAMEVPGIVSDALGQRDTIQDHVSGLLVRTKNVEDVVNAMVYCIDNPKIIQEMGLRARKIVEEKYEQALLFEKLAEHRNTLIDLGR